MTSVGLLRRAGQGECFHLSCGSVPDTLSAGGRSHLSPAIRNGPSRLTDQSLDMAVVLDLPRDAGTRPLVCVQGLGFVGAAMAATVAAARDARGEPRFTVVGVELDTEAGRARAEALRSGRFPFACADPKIEAAVTAAHAAGNLTATTEQRIYSLASVAVVDVSLDVGETETGVESDLALFRGAIETLGATMPPGSLVLVETTVPPGTCEHVAAPALAAAAEKRGLASDAIRLSHSYERVMPGPDYYDSIVNFWRVYAGHSEAAADQCEEFLRAVINTDEYPLTRLESTTASETAKVLENSYRAVNIAFIEEWSRFAEAVGIDLFQVIDAIRMRPTHNNMRQPGFGVGGYCLTKDPLFPSVTAKEFLGRSDLAFPFGEESVRVNNNMPLANLRRLTELLGGSLAARRLLVLGAAYRSEVDDTRSSPSETFIRAAQDAGATVVCHDAHVRDWPEMGLRLDPALPAADGFDAVVLAVPHKAYEELDFVDWLGSSRPLVYDANNVLAGTMRIRLRTEGFVVESTGRGLGL